MHQHRAGHPDDIGIKIGEEFDRDIVDQWQADRHLEYAFTISRWCDGDYVTGIVAWHIACPKQLAVEDKSPYANRADALLFILPPIWPIQGLDDFGIDEETVTQPCIDPLDCWQSCNFQRVAQANTGLPALIGVAIETYIRHTCPQFACPALPPSCYGISFNTFRW